MRLHCAYAVLGDVFADRIQAALVSKKEVMMEDTRN